MSIEIGCCKIKAIANANPAIIPFKTNDSDLLTALPNNTDRLSHFPQSFFFMSGGQQFLIISALTSDDGSDFFSVILIMGIFQGGFLRLFNPKIYISFMKEGFNVAFETPEKIVGSNIDSSEESDIERLQRQRQRKLSPEDCEGVVKKSKSYMILILVLSGLIITPLLIGMFVTPSAIVDIRVDLKGINVNPDRLIRIDTDMYVSTANATFTPSFLFVGVLYPATEGLYEREIYLGQYPNRVFSEPLKDTIANLNGVTDFFFSSSFLALTPNTGNELKLRLSADYSIVIKGIE